MVKVWDNKVMKLSEDVIGLKGSATCGEQDFLAGPAPRARYWAGGVITDPDEAAAHADRQTGKQEPVISTRSKSGSDEDIGTTCRKIEKSRNRGAWPGSIEGKCIACGARCQTVCPKHAVDMTDQGEPLVDMTRCTGCRKCVKICPAAGLEIYYTPEQLKLLEELAAQGQRIDSQEADEEQVVAGNGLYRGVWVFVEQTDGKPAAVSWELLGIGQTLAKQLKVELCAVVIGEKVEPLCNEAFAYGAGRVYLVDGPVFRYYRTEPYFKALCYLANKYKPEIILIGATGRGTGPGGSGGHRAAHRADGRLHRASSR